MMYIYKYIIYNVLASTESCVSIGLLLTLVILFSLYSNTCMAP